jgi:hypothetical protein
MKATYLTVILCLFAVSVFSQTEASRKFDEFSFINCDEYLARMQNVYLEQKNKPNSKVYFVVYEGMIKTPIYKDGKVIKSMNILPQFGMADAKIKSMKKWLSRQKAPPENFIFVNGGFRDYFGVEIWLVPPGGDLPEPTPTLKKIKYRKGKPTGFCLECCGV